MRLTYTKFFRFQDLTQKILPTSKTGAGAGGLWLNLELLNLAWWVPPVVVFGGDSAWWWAEAEGEGKGPMWEKMRRKSFGRKKSKISNPNLLYSSVILNFYLFFYFNKITLVQLTKTVTYYKKLFTEKEVFRSITPWDM